MSMPAPKDCDVARAWRGVSDSNRYQLEPRVRKRLADAETTYRKIEGLLQIAAQKTVNDAEIVAYADANPALSRLPAAAAELVEGLPLNERIDLARRRVAALAEMDALIARADKPSLKTHDDENRIADRWQVHRQLLEPWSSANNRLAPRTKRAADRLSRTERLAAAQAAGDQALLLTAWGDDGALEDYEPAARFKPAVADARKIADKMQALRERLIHARDDDSAVLSIARTVAPFMTTPYATAPLAELGGQSLSGLVAFAERRALFVEELQAASQEPTGRRLLALAAAWDAAFDRNHPRIKSHLGLLTEGSRLRDKLAELRKALQSDNASAVIACWDDASFGNLEELARDAPRIKQMLRAYVEKATPFAPRPLGGVTRRPGHRMLLAWDWRDERITHAYVLIGDKHAPESEAQALETRLVERRETLDRGGIEVQFSGGLLVAEIRPALLFEGERLEGANRLIVREAAKRVLSYRIQANMMGLGSRVLKIAADRAIQLPQLELVAGENERLLAWSETATDKDGKLDIDLGGGLSFRRRPVMLRLRHPRDAEWIEDPAPRRSRAEDRGMSSPRLRHTRCPYCGAGFYLSDAAFICDICDPDTADDLSGTSERYPRVEIARAEQLEPIVLPLPAHVVARWGWVEDFKSRAEVWLTKAAVPSSIKMRCGHTSNRQRCPHCHATLPDNIRTAAPFIVSVLGPPGVGKSHFIAALIDVLQGDSALDRRGLLDKIDHAIRPIGDTAEEYRERFYEPVYEQRSVLPITPGLKQSPVARVPLVYEIARRNGENALATNLSLFDVPGEDAINRRDLATHGRHVLNSDAVICMLGPSAPGETRDQLDAAGRKAIDVLIEAAERINGRKGPGGRAAAIPLAVVITKSDMLAERNALPPELVDAVEPSSIDDARAHSDTICLSRGLIEACSGLRELPGRLEREFTKVGYFAVSSIGFAPEGGSLDRLPKPHRVEEPLLWLLATRGDRWRGR